MAPYQESACYIDYFRPRFVDVHRTQSGSHHVIQFYGLALYLGLEELRTLHAQLSSHLDAEQASML